MTRNPLPPSARRTRVAVIGGGRNSEHDVSLASAASVGAALAATGYDVLALTIARDGRWAEDAGRPLAASAAGSLAAALDALTACDAVFPILHGPRGEDGSLAAVLDLAGLPYVGTGVRGGALAMDKWATKLLAADLGISTATGRVVTPAEAAGLRYERPVVVKPAGAGSSHGVSLVRSAAHLVTALDAAFDLDDRVLVEELVAGREVDVAVLERADGSLLVGTPLEVLLADGELFDTGRKYGGGARFRVPAAVTGAEHAALAAASLALFGALGCAGVVRCDFFVTADGLLLNEVNTAPGMTDRSQVPLMFTGKGLSYPELLDELVRGALRHGRR